MSASGLAQLDAVGLATCVRNREIGVDDVLDDALARIAETDRAIGAVAALTEAAARAQAKLLNPDAPFAGVPILIKDLGSNVAGTVQACGCRYLAGHGQPAAQDDALIRRYRAAGFVVLGKTTVPEFGLNLSTEPAIGPVCRNPWDRSRIAGGSSGGSAAAVAAGMVPVAHATDAGGSIRVPAACCGLVGLKPGRDVMPEGPNFANHLFGLASEHVLARTVRDSAAIFAATRREPAAAPDLDRPPAPARIGVLTDGPDGGTVAPACRDAALRMAGVLDSAGHAIEPLEIGDLADDLHVAARAFADIIAANLAFELGRMDPPPADDDLEPITWAVVERGRAMDAAALVATSRAMLDVAYRMAALFRRIDVLLTPALADLPPRLGAFPTDHGDLDAHYRRLGAFAPFSALFNVTGQPAISVPAGLSPEGLPLGVQLAGPDGAEDLLLRLARQIELAAPWPLRPATADVEAVA